MASVYRFNNIAVVPVANIRRSIYTDASIQSGLLWNYPTGGDTDRMDYVRARERRHILRAHRAGLTDGPGGEEEREINGEHGAVDGEGEEQSHDVAHANHPQRITEPVWPSRHTSITPPSPRWWSPQSFNASSPSFDSARSDVASDGLGDVTGNDDEEPKLPDTSTILRLVVEGILSTKMTRDTYDGLDHLRTFGFPIPEATFSSRYRVEAALEKEASIPAKEIDCCIRGCVLFYGKRALDTKCPCGQDRYKRGETTARRTFSYISPVHRLRSMYQNEAIAPMLSYRISRQAHPGTLSDVFDGAHYLGLRQSDVKWLGSVVQPSQKYFESPTDIALMLATDGVPLFKRKGLAVWPLMVTVLSLPPQLRYRKEYQICCGLIPTRLVNDDDLTVRFDSFLEPLIDDLEMLATTGLQMRGWVDNVWQRFALKAHLIAIIGDMRADQKIMNFKGPNALLSCRWCKLESSPSASGRHLYPVSTFADASGRRCLRHFELRSDREIKRTSRQIRRASRGRERERLRMQSGIKGETRLYAVDSIDFAISFPVDLMHLFFENVMKELLDLWEGRYKVGQIIGDPDGRLRDDFVIPRHVWRDISHDITVSNASVPTQIAASIDPIHLRSRWTADTYCYFLTYLGPIVLKDRLSTRYYRHFIRLSTIVKNLIAVSILRVDLPSLKGRIDEWVLDFEKLYYRGRSQYMVLCTAPIHAMLHITGCIEAFGPASYYWCFSIERYGGWLKQELANNRHPVKMISNRVAKEERIFELLGHVAPAMRRKVLRWANRERERGTGTSLEPVDLDVVDPRFRDPVPFSPSIEVLNAIHTYLIAREYTDTNRHPVIDKAEVIEVVPRKSWSAFDGGSAKANQVWRTGENRREADKRDASWALYYQVEDENRWVRRRNIPTIFSPPQRQWGKVLHFLDFVWRGETLQLAVMEPHRVEPWVIEVGALGAVAGRIFVTVGPRMAEVVFETTLGACKPEIRDV